MKVVINTWLHPAILDPQGKAIEECLQCLNITGITNVRQGKQFSIEIDPNHPEPLVLVRELRKAAEQHLINPVMETYETTIYFDDGHVVECTELDKQEQ